MEMNKGEQEGKGSGKKVFKYVDPDERAAVNRALLA